MKKFLMVLVLSISATVGLYAVTAHAAAAHDSVSGVLGQCTPAGC